MTLCTRSKQLRTIKTIIYNDIFTSLRRKKIQSSAKQFKELFSVVCYFFALNLPFSALNYLKTVFILNNQKLVIQFKSLFSPFFLIHLFLRSWWTATLSKRKQIVIWDIPRLGYSWISMGSFLLNFRSRYRTQNNKMEIVQCFLKIRFRFPRSRIYLYVGLF